MRKSKTSSFLFISFSFLILFLFLALFFVSIPLTTLAQDSNTILLNIIDSDDEKELLSIISNWQNKNDENSPLYIGVAYHNLALIDSEKYANLSIEWLNRYKGKTFASVALAYKGSAITLVANSLSKKKDFMGATAKINEGFDLLDKAIKMDPENVIIRFLRAENGIEITENTPFNRSKVVEEDLKFLEKKLLTFKQTEKAQYYLILGRLKLFQKKINEAISALKQVIKEAPDSKHAKKAKQILSKLED